MSAIEYRVAHKLLFGSDFPFFTARQTIDGLRSVTGTAFGPHMPVVDEQVVEDIIHRPTLDLLEIASRGLSVLRGHAATISTARETSSSPIRRWVTKRTRLVSRSIPRTPRSARSRGIRP